MKWLPLDLGSVAEIDSQAEESINTLRALCEQHRTAAAHQQASGASQQQHLSKMQQLFKAISVLRSAMTNRIAGLDQFYHENDLDPRAARLESTRLRMKKALRDLDVGGVDDQDPATPAAAAAQPKGPSSVSERAAAAFGMGGVTPSRTAKQQQQQHATPSHSSNGGGQPEMVQVRILMTPQEYEELRRRRDIMRAAHVRASEHIGGATMSVNGPSSLLYNPSAAAQQQQHQKKGGGSSVATQGGSLSWEHAAEMAQHRGHVAPPIVRASGAYTEMDPTGALLPRSQGRTGVSIARAKFTPNFEMNKPSPRPTGRYASPRVAATGGARAVGGAYSSAPAAGISVSQVDKLRSFGPR